MSRKGKRKSLKMAEEQKKAAENVEETAAEEQELPEAENAEAEVAVAAEETADNTTDDTAGEAPKYEAMTLTAEEVKALKEKLDKLEADRADAVKQAQRLQAEFENYRKRNASLSQDSRDEGVRETVKQLLPVLDSFERALKTAPEGEAFADGMRNIEKQLVSALEKCGTEEVETEGDFDPNLHDAVMKEQKEGVEPGKITEVFQKGYRVKGRIVRFSMVKVSE